MKTFLLNLFWFTLSAKLSLSVSDTKHHINDLYNRIQSGKLSMNDLSPDLFGAVEFYAENITYLNG